MAGLTALALLAVRPVPARSTCTLGALSLPAYIAADGNSEAAIFCAISNGYPNNIYAIKSTFSDGELPYFGLTYNFATTLWSVQNGRWDTTQPRVQTDAQGAWSGWVFVRLEDTAPKGSILWRLSATPLSPIELPGPTTGAWTPVTALNTSGAGTGGWLCGHVYTDPQCTHLASGVVVCAYDSGDTLLAAYLSQDSLINDGCDHTDLGSFRLAVPQGSVARVSGRTRMNTTVSLYVKRAGPWSIRAGYATSVDTLPWGDVVGDGVFDGQDVVLALRLCAGLYRSPAAAARADVWPSPPDGRVTVGDAITLERRLLGPP